MKVYEFFTDKNKWTKNAYARGRSGKSLPIDSEYAIAFCVSGAILKCYGLQKEVKESSEKYTEAMKRADGIRNKLEAYLIRNRKTSYVGGVVLWNDDPDLTFEEMIQTLKEVDI
jgi:hypothetical protein